MQLSSSPRKENWLQAFTGYSVERMSLLALTHKTEGFADAIDLNGKDRRKEEVGQMWQTLFDHEFEGLMAQPLIGSQLTSGFLHLAKHHG